MALDSGKPHRTGTRSARWAWNLIFIGTNFVPDTLLAMLHVFSLLPRLPHTAFHTSYFSDENPEAPKIVCLLGLVEERWKLWSSSDVGTTLPLTTKAWGKEKLKIIDIKNRFGKLMRSLWPLDQSRNVAKHICGKRWTDRTDASIMEESLTYVVLFRKIFQVNSVMLLLTHLDG